ncbi:MAG: RibD family protein [Alphaproteobacteria bacterium]
MNDGHWADLLASAGGGELVAKGVRTRRADTALTRALEPLVQAKRLDTPLVVAQLGQSLDGRIATPTGSSRGINGDVAMTHLHRLRALVDAVIVGAGTARTDDPQLTVRNCLGESPVRVVIDPRGTVQPDAQVWCPDDGVKRMVFGRADGLDSSIERLDVPGETIPSSYLLSALREHGLSRVLIEGGGKTVSQFLAADAVDHLHLMFGPVIIGSGLVGLNLPQIEGLEQAKRPEVDVHVYDEGDVLFACKLR